jgi:hypothetical protein
MRPRAGREDKTAKLVRILVIGSILSAVDGAVVFRLAWAFTKQTRISCWIVFALAGAVAKRKRMGLEDKPPFKDYP